MMIIITKNYYKFLCSLLGDIKGLIHGVERERKNSFFIVKEQTNILQWHIKNDKPLELWQVLIIFICRNLKSELNFQRSPIVCRKTLSGNIEFKGDTARGFVNKWFSKSLRKTFYSIRLRVVFSKLLKLNCWIIFTYYLIRIFYEMFSSVRLLVLFALIS